MDPPLRLSRSLQCEARTPGVPSRQGSREAMGQDLWGPSSLLISPKDPSIHHHHYRCIPTAAGANAGVERHPEDLLCPQIDAIEGIWDTF